MRFRVGASFRIVFVPATSSPSLWKVCWSLLWFWKPCSASSKRRHPETGSNLLFVPLPALPSVCSLDLGLSHEPLHDQGQTNHLVQLLLVEFLCFSGTLKPLLEPVPSSFRWANVSFLSLAASFHHSATHHESRDIFHVYSVYSFVEPNSSRNHYL